MGFGVGFGGDGSFAAPFVWSKCSGLAAISHLRNPYRDPLSWLEITGGIGQAIGKHQAEDGEEQDACDNLNKFAKVALVIF